MCFIERITKIIYYTRQHVANVQVASLTSAMWTNVTRPSRPGRPGTKPSTPAKTWTLTLSLWCQLQPIMLWTQLLRHLVVPFNLFFISKSIYFEVKVIYSYLWLQCICKPRIWTFIRISQSAWLQNNAAIKWKHNTILALTTLTLNFPQVCAPTHHILNQHFGQPGEEGARMAHLRGCPAAGPWWTCLTAPGIRENPITLEVLRIAFNAWLSTTKFFCGMITHVRGLSALSVRLTCELSCSNDHDVQLNYLIWNSKLTTWIWCIWSEFWNCGSDFENRIKKW